MINFLANINKGIIIILLLGFASQCQKNEPVEAVRREGGDNVQLNVNNMAAALKVTWSCLKAWFCIYGSWLYFNSLFCPSMPMAASGLILLLVILRLGRIPPPDPEVVEEILGVDPLSVEQTDIKETNDTEKYIMRSIAHRGAAFDAPENSISAIKLAKEKGMTAVEFDVALTKDDVPVVFHDETVDRMTEATGRIADMSWEEVQNLDISEKHPLGYNGDLVGISESQIFCNGFEILFSVHSHKEKLYIDLAIEKVFDSSN